MRKGKKRGAKGSRSKREGGSSKAPPERASTGGSVGRALVAEVRSLTQQLRRRELSRQRLTTEAERLKTQNEAALGIAHDVNNVLAALRLRVGILLKDSDCMATQASNIEAINRILREGTALVSKLQGYGRVSEPRIGSVDLRETIRAAVEIAQSGLRRRALETGVEVRIHCELEPLPPIRGLAEELRHVFVNLLINARDAMPQGGTVLVRGRGTGRTVMVTVEDEGDGIDEAVLPKIFDPFFSTKGDKGTGMGLAMARNVMERMDSTIVARNRSEGGACFELCFSPFAGSPPRPAARPSHGARTPTPGSGGQARAAEVTAAYASQRSVIVSRA